MFILSIFTVSALQNAENENNTILNKNYKTAGFLKKFGLLFSISRTNQHVKMSNFWFHTSYHVNKVPNTESVSYVVWLG